MKSISESVPFALFSIFILLLSGCRNDMSTPESGSAESGGEKSGRNISDQEFADQFNKAAGLMGQFQYPQAFEIYATLLESRPEDNELIVNAAIARLNMAGDGDLAIAMELLEQVLAREPEHVRGNYSAGLIKSYMGPPASPTNHFGIASAAVPTDADAAYLYAKSLEQDERNEEAAREYRRCLKLNPYYASAILGLGRIARMNGDTDEATRLLTEFELLKSNPNGKVFEFAYRRMGSLGEVVALSAPPAPTEKPAGNSFADPTPVSIDGEFAFSGSPRQMAAADINSDGLVDLMVGDESGVHLLLNSGSSGFVVDNSAPWRETDRVRAIAIGDVDQNGRNDLFLSRNGRNQLWLQDENGNWSESTDPILSADEFETASSRLIDSDHDGDLDIICCNQNGPLQIFNNNRDETFRSLELEGIDLAATGNQSLLALGDFDNHRDTDILLAGGNVTTLLWNDRLWKYRVEPNLPAGLSAGEVVGCLTGDFDHDGMIDVVIRRTGNMQVWSLHPADGWRMLATLKMEDEGDDLSFAVIDVDGNGSMELITAGPSGFWVRPLMSEGSGELIPATVESWTTMVLEPAKGYSIVYADDSGKLHLIAPGTGRHPFVAMKFTGAESEAESMRSNISGIGTRWKAQIGSEWTTGISLPVVAGPNQSLQPDLVGMRGVESIDFVAVDWTDGVFQAELGLRPGEPVLIDETQRQLASCPVIFTWNGEKIEFVTDVLGVGGLGFLTAPGEYATPRPWENLMLSPDNLKPKDDRLIVKIGEPMEEACYLKSARLVSVSLPDGWEYVVDERMGISDPQPTGNICFYRNRYPVVAASSSLEDDVLQSLVTVDRKAPSVGQLDTRFIGLLAEEQSIQFSFGQLPERNGRYALVIDGWLEYPYSQTVFAALQAGRQYEAPSLDIRHPESNQWVTAWAGFGYPAGMPRTMMLPLPDSFEPGCELRIRTSLQVYWDRIELVELENCDEAVLRELALSRAEVRRVGFPERSTGEQFQPYYDYSRRSGTWDSRHLPGFYTRLGEVTDWMRNSSSPLVIFGPGEEVHMEFEADAESRTTNLRGYVLKLEGWCKDMDLYTGSGNQLGPLPYSGANSLGKKPEYDADLNYRYESGPWYPVLMPESLSGNTHSRLRSQR